MHESERNYCSESLEKVIQLRYPCFKFANSVEDVRTLDDEQVGIAPNLFFGKIGKDAAVETRVVDSQVADGDVLLLQTSVHLSPLLE